MGQRIGDPLPDLTLYLRRMGKHGAIIDWFTDGAHSDPQNGLHGTIMYIVVGERTAPVKTFTTTSVVNNRATWHFSEDDTDLPFNQYDGMILLDDAGNVTPMANLKIIVQPS